MKYLKQVVGVFFTAFVIGNANAGCKFSWHHYGDESIKERIGKKIGAEVTDAFCKYAKKYEIVIMTSNFTNQTLALGHATVGLRKKGTDIVPLVRMTSYRSADGNYVMAYGYELASNAAIDGVIEVMADLPRFVPE
ncbi:hypothetical protein [Limnobacter sp.]